MSSEPHNFVPAPLGWCSVHLHDSGERVQAVTIMGGSAICQACNAKMYGDK